MLRIKTTNYKLRGVGAPIGKLESSCIRGSFRLIVLLVIDITDKETSSLIGKALRRS